MDVFSWNLNDLDVYVSQIGHSIVRNRLAPDNRCLPDREPIVHAWCVSNELSPHL